jgi:mycothiol synthase
VSDLSSRAVSRDDASSILAIVTARDIEDLGYPDYTLEDVRHELADSQEARVVLDGSEVVAFAMLDGADARVAVHPDACGRGIGTSLLRWAEEHGATRQPVFGSNDAARRLLERAGWKATQRHWRMALDLSLDSQGVSWPEGVSMRGFRSDDGPVAWALVERTVRAGPGFTPRPWRDRYAAELSSVGFAGDALAGVALCERWDEEGKGYVSYLGVDDAHRGRGLGRALLLESFAKMRAAGLLTAELSVNGENESATRLYTSAGMKVASHSDRYDRGIT